MLLKQLATEQNTLQTGTCVFAMHFRGGLLQAQPERLTYFKSIFFNSCNRSSNLYSPTHVERFAVVFASSFEYHT